MEHNGIATEHSPQEVIKSQIEETTGPLDAPRCDRIMAIVTSTCLLFFTLLQLEKIKQATMQQHVVVNGYAYDFSMLHLYPRLLEHVILENDLSYRNFDVSSYALRNVGRLYHLE